MGVLTRRHEVEWVIVKELAHHEHQHHKNGQHSREYYHNSHHVSLTEVMEDSETTEFTHLGSVEQT